MQKERIWIPGISLLILVFYSVVLLLLGDYSHICLWIGFGFAVVTFLANAGLLWYCVHNPLNAEETFYQAPLLRISAFWDGASLVFSIIAAFMPNGAVRWAVILELGLTVLFVILAVSALMGGQKLRDIRDENKEKTSNIKNEDRIHKEKP